jgi:hypothetical protein
MSNPDYILLVPVDFPGYHLGPGHGLYTVSEAAIISAIQAAYPGALWAGSDANVEAAAAQVQAMRGTWDEARMSAVLLAAAAATLSAQGSPAPTAAGKLLYDTGAAYAETAAGTVHQVLHGAAGAPTWSAVDLTADVTGLLPDANVNPANNGGVQVVQDAGTMVAGSLVVSSGITVRAGSKFLPVRNNPDATAAHWGKLSTGSAVVGGPGTGSITVSSSNAADTSSVSLVIFG